MAETDIRVMVPRVRRALEGAGAPEVLTDDAVKDLTADAIAEILLYTGGVFGKTLVVTEVEAVTDVPLEYATDPALTLPEQSVVAIQAALNYFFQQFAGRKVSERISDEAQTWEYTLSAQLLTGQLQLLVAERNRALQALEALGAAPLESYASFLEARDVYTARLIEPWVSGTLGGGLEIDYRFS